jgi:hypothetical protein
MPPGRGGRRRRCGSGCTPRSGTGRGSRGRRRPRWRVPCAYGPFGEKKLYGKTVTGVICSTVIVDENGKVAHASYNVKTTGQVAKQSRTSASDPASVTWPMTVIWVPDHRDLDDLTSPSPGSPAPHESTAEPSSTATATYSNASTPPPARQLLGRAGQRRSAGPPSRPT